VKKTLHRMLGAAVLLAVAFPMASTVQAQKMSVLAGKVMQDSSEIPVLGAEITVQGVRGGAISDSLGRFVLGNIPSGKALVTIKRLGFSPITAVLTFAPGDTLEGEFLLVTTAARLKGVEIRGKSRDPARLIAFEERRKSGFGQFIGPEVLAKMEARRTDDVLRTIPGPVIQRSNVSSAAWVAAGRGAYSNGLYKVERMDITRGADPGKCYSTVYLDGVAVFSALAGETLFDINSVPPAQIHGIEYYSSSGTIPPQFPEKRGTCGVIVVWTKV
jgi:carboxypeptidase-like protein